MISVIIPVYNTEKYLDDCVSSVLGQDYQDIEVLLVDDGSKDNSRSLCEKWAQRDSRVRFFHKENGGPSTARNLALDNINGEYISFVDSDDLIAKDMYSSLIDAINKNNSDIAICKTNTFVDGTTPVIDENNDTEYLNMNSFEAMEMRMNSDFRISDTLWNKLYKAELFENLRFPENRILSEDTAIMYRIIAVSKKVTYINKTGYLVRERKGSLSRVKYDSRWLMTLNTYEEMVDFILNNEDYKTFIFKAQLFANGAVFYNAGEFFLSKVNDDEIKRLIKSHAKKQLKEYKKIKFKNKILLWLIANAFPMYGLFYKFSKRG